MEEGRNDILIALNSKQIAHSNRFQSYLKVTLIVVIANLLTFNLGFVIGFTSPAIRDLENGKDDSVRLESNEVTWFGSILYLPAIIGSLICGPIMDLLGRRKTILLTSVIFAIGWLFIQLSKTVTLLLLGRGVNGLAYGMCGAVIPVYVGEICPSRIRGFLGSFFNLILAFGILFAFLFGNSFRWVSLAQIGFGQACFTFLMCVLIPESPYWSASKAKLYEAEKSLKKLSYQTSKARIQEQLFEIESTIERSSEKIQAKDLLKPAFYKPTLIAVGLNVLQHLSGNSAIIYYIHSIFEIANFKNESIPSILAGSFQVIGLLIAAFLIDRVGRKKLFITSCIGCSLCLSVLGGSMYAMTTLHSQQSNISENATLIGVDIHSSTSHSVFGWLALVSTLVYMIFYAVGLGPIPFVIVGEMIPLNARGITGGLAISANCLSAFFVLKTFRFFCDLLHIYGVFWVFSGITICAAPVIWLILPETNGKSLIEIQDLYKKS